MDDSPTTTIKLVRVVKRWPGSSSPAVDEVSLFVAGGEFVVLVGESGSGKTTTLKMVNRLVEPDAGEVRIDGERVGSLDPIALRRSIGYVFQDFGLFPHMTVGENVGIVMELKGVEAGRIRSRVDELLESMGLEPGTFRERKPASLSGGQKQRVGLARALAEEPRVMLMDEPFGALDPMTRRDLQRDLMSLRKRLGLTLLMVTHDMVEALILADRVAVMRSGKILQIGTPHELLTRPVDDYVAGLMQGPREQADLIEELVAGER